MQEVKDLNSGGAYPRHRRRGNQYNGAAQSTSSLLMSDENSGETPKTKSDTNIGMIRTDGYADKTKARFMGRNVLLTGASGGLGRALALQLARCGAETLVLSGRDEVILQNVADAVKNLGKKAEKDCLPGGVDVLINNGGISSRSSFLDTKSDVDELLMRVNFLSGTILAKEVVPGMVKKGEGAVIWIGGVQGLVGIPNRTSNVASKFVIQGNCESLRAELATSGVTVHVASPSYIRTDLSRSALRGNGESHGKLDAITESGAGPNDVAMDILDSVAEGKSDFLIAANFSIRAARWLKLIAPLFLEKMLVKRYEKSLGEE